MIWTFKQKLMLAFEEFDVLFRQEMFWFWPILVRQMGRDDIVAAIFKAFNSQLTLGIRVTRLHAWLANYLSASFCCSREISLLLQHQTLKFISRSMGALWQRLLISLFRPLFFRDKTFLTYCGRRWSTQFPTAGRFGIRRNFKLARDSNSFKKCSAVSGTMIAQ